MDKFFIIVDVPKGSFDIVENKTISKDDDWFRQQHKAFNSVEDALCYGLSICMTHKNPRCYFYLDITRLSRRNNKKCRLAYDKYVKRHPEYRTE